MTYQTLLNDIRKRILEMTSGVIGDEDLIFWMNLVQIEICSEILTQDKVKKITLNFVDGKADLPADFLAFYFAKDFHFVPLKDFEKKAKPKMLCRKDNEILVHPKETLSLDLFYFRRPIEITTANLLTKPDLSIVFYESLILGTIAKALEMMQEFELSNAYLTKYRVSLENAKKSVSYLEEKEWKAKPLFEVPKFI